MLLKRSGGSFSLFTQSVVVLMEKPGLQEIIEKNKMMVSKIANNLDLLILCLLSGVFANEGFCLFSYNNNEYWFRPAVKVCSFIARLALYFLLVQKGNKPACR